LSDRARASAEPSFSFGCFRLLPSQQQLLQGDQPVRLGTRALDILTALVERAGELVTKEDLIARVWPGTFVEEATLRVHVAAMRRALGDDQTARRFVVNVPGRGYRFVAPVICAQSALQGAAPTPPAPHNLPVRLTPALGRADVVAALAARLPKQRFITIVGPGGMGKTTVALTIADALSADYRDGVRFVDLAPIADSLLVPSAVASALGAPILSDDIFQGLAASLRDKQMLLVLDNCEHVIDASATLAAMLLTAPGVQLLATSREPLRADGEHVHRLAPLELPPAAPTVTAAEALTYSAVQLFVARAAASRDGFMLSDADAPVVAEICRRLDGIALAIELAAGRVDAFGIRGIAEGLNDRFRLLTHGRRTALLRHQTMRATLDWSNELLPEAERIIFRRLAVFAGSFSIDAAASVVASGDISPSDAADGVAGLVAKSLLVADFSKPVGRYRLLETTRAFALEKLSQSGESAKLARRHAEYFRDIFRRHGASSWETGPTEAWRTTCSTQIDNVRAALDWASSPGGDAAVGVALTAAAMPLWLQLSLMDECRARTAQALSHLEGGSIVEGLVAMQLHAAHGLTSLYIKGPSESAEAAWKSALDLAERLGDVEQRLQALWGTWTVPVLRGEYGNTLALAWKYRDLAETMSRPGERLIGDRMVGTSLHYLGDQAGARRHIEHMLDRYAASAHWSNASNRLQARMILARILWLQGLPDQALGVVRADIEGAHDIVTAPSFCHGITEGGCPVALLTGELPAAETFVAQLLDHAERHSLHLWYAWGRRFAAALRIRRGDMDGLESLGAALAEPGETALLPDRCMFLGMLAEGLGLAGRTADGLARIDEALARARRNQENWCLPELLRIKGDILCLDRGADTAVEEQFLESLAAARRQGALSWELRTAISLARLWRDQGRTDEVRRMLPPIHRRFREGFATADLKAAKELLDEIA